MDSTEFPNGTRDISEMTDREIMEETLVWLRQAGSALAQLSGGGIGRMMMSAIGSSRRV